jgi:AraC family transcriptional regulator, regulatory protein of adaptative response / methylphosphotriester-DNA alkyltransferase methyltransferase
MVTGTALAIKPIKSKRKEELARQYLTALDHHIAALKAGTVERALGIRDFAAILHVHPVHLSNTIKQATGKSTCDHYEERLVRISKELLLESNVPIAQIARHLTYDPSNFTKFFKHFTGLTPGQFRNGHFLNKT